MSSSTWAQLSTPLSITYSLAASEQHSGMWSLLPANSGTPNTTHRGCLLSGTSFQQNVTLWSWLKMPVPSSLVSCPRAALASPQPSILDRPHERDSQRTDIPLCLHTAGGHPIMYTFLNDIREVKWLSELIYPLLVFFLTNIKIPT